MKNLRPLTGKELKIAAKKGLKVRYVERYYNPMDSHMNYNRICKMTPAAEGYYIGNSDIEVDCWKDDDIIDFIEFGEGDFGVYAVPGTKYE
jgi:hypothetical protein